MRDAVRRYLPPAHEVAVWTKFFLDVAVWSAAAPIAYLLRLEGNVVGYMPSLVVYTAAGTVLKVVAVYGFQFHRRAWRWIGVRDLFWLIVAVCGVMLVQGTGVLVADGWGTDLVFPRSVPVIEAALAILGLSALRLSRRLRHERARRAEASDTKRVLVVGAGDAGVLLVRELLRHPETGLVPVGYLDDDPIKSNRPRMGVPVLGTLADLEAVVAEQAIDEVLLAMPSAPGRVVREVVEAARRADVSSRAVPRLTDLATGRVHIDEVREIDLEDLLGREPVRLDTKPIRAYVTGRVVLVTGAGGSIGSEIVRQVAAFEPAAIVLLGRGENSVYQIDREVGRRWPDVPRHAVICDVRDRASLRDVFERFRPEVVFHAAAHKHVPLMEANPAQAVLNNVVGTRNVAELACEHGADRLVNVSTDKAVNPTNVMGASKRAAEMVVSSVGARPDCACTMVSVRFGNVLGSRGSVVPLFRDQIARGGPVTVTHPDMVRYFMTIPEASQLVLQAGAFAERGRVYVLDMGEPVRIADLARDLILLSGLEPGEDIEIAYSGARPGEKLFEELLMAEEGTEPGPHEKIFVARKARVVGGLGGRLAALVEAAEANDGDGVRTAFRAVVETYRPDHAAPTGSVASTVRAGGDGGVPVEAGVLDEAGYEDATLSP
ncbi:polysaccharide biosynthesis protein [Rubrivirga marina]|uniref:Polysaccharide biosynthesis protein CapD-like domain-containing protein n=1 Tax=Rubrivirga marina TaxID=1196024 RepID=A0A271J0B1_9BACT|nr:nucleoside-diphosphate sugar epimerase/dehydratase [Rubrivirga marina]PAP76395.1 hypothetical protein BSZ37_08030 [Rubrivirga marina]